MEDILANPRIYSCDIVLSRKGANTLRDVFVTRWKLDKNRFTIHAHGAKRTAASNATPYGRAKNRRVIVLVVPYVKGGGINDLTVIQAKAKF